MEAPAPALQAAPALRVGDEVAVFAPSSHAGREPQLLERAHEVLAGWGLRPRALEVPEPRHLYLAGKDTERAAHLQALYGDPSVKALFAARGGYGATRLLPLLDGDRLRAAAPKAVVGMSDVAALFPLLQAVSGTATLHGPCLGAPALHRSPAREENLARLHAALFTPQAPIVLPCRLLTPGRGAAASGADPLRGRLVGGNLTVLAALAGTPWAPDCRGAILFLEDVNEAPYRIDRALTQLRQAGWLDGLVAMVFGDMVGCDDRHPGLLHDTLRDLFAAAAFPVLVGLPCGHGSVNATLPLGRGAELRMEGWQADRAAELTIG